MGSDFFSRKVSKFSNRDQWVAHYPKTTGNRVELLIDGKQIFEEGIFPLIDSAQSRIHISMFQWRAGKISDCLAEKLIEKARQGLEVRIMVDSEGARQFGWNRSYRQLQELEKIPGIRVMRSPLSSTLNGSGKIHHKMVIVDSKLAIMGSTNIRDESQEEIHDLMLKLEGPSVLDIEKEYRVNWCCLGGEMDRAELEPRSPIAAQGDVFVQVVQGMGTHNPEVIKTGIQLILEAKQSIVIEDSYITNPQVHKALIQKLKEGCEVTVIIPKVNDWAGVPSLAMENVMEKMSRLGAQIFLYPKRLHGKALLIDDRKLFTGSAAYLGIPMQDINLLIEDSVIIAQFKERLFEHDKAVSKQLKKEDCDKRNLWNRFVSYVWEKIFAGISYSV